MIRVRSTDSIFPRLSVPATAGLMLLLVGCAMPGELPWSANAGASWRGSSSDPETTSLSATDDQPPVDTPDRPTLPVLKVSTPAPDSAIPVRQVTLLLNVLRVEAPAGSFTDNGELWDLLDETAAAPQTVLTLRENGFRFGVGRPELWPTFRERLTRLPMVRTVFDQSVPPQDRPIELELSARLDDLSVFVFERNGSMRGCLFGDARPLLRVDLGARPQEAGATQIEVAPEIRRPPGPMKYVHNGQTFERRNEQLGRVFDDLAFSTALRAGAFVVVGPARSVSGSPVLGRPFFLRDDAGTVRENLYILSPQTHESTTWWVDRTLTDAALRPTR